MNFHTLLSMAFFHDYYASGLSNDFKVTPGVDTRRFFDRQRMKFGGGGANSTGFTIGYRGSGMGVFPQIAFPDRFRMVFFLQLRDIHLPNVTYLAGKTRKQAYYFDNLSFFKQTTPPASPIKSDHYGVDLVPKSFIHTFTWPGGANPVADPATVEVYDALQTPGVDTPLKTFEATPDDMLNYRMEIDLTGFEEGKYQLRHTDTGYATSNRDVIISEEAWRDSTFAVIEIWRDMGNAPYEWDPVSEVPAWLIQLRRSSAVWKYWVIQKPNATGYSFDDSAPNGDPPYNFEVYLNESSTVAGYNAADDQETLNYLKARYPGSTVLLYLSTIGAAGSSGMRWIDYYEIPKKGLELLDSDLANSRLYRHLPIPQRKRIKPEIFLCLVDQTEDIVDTTS